MTTSRSPLREALGDYLSLRRALGFQLASAGRLLGQFVGYLEAHGMDAVTAEHALAWATQPAGASVHWQAIRLSVLPSGLAVHVHLPSRTVERHSLTEKLAKLENLAVRFHGGCLLTQEETAE